jgi:type III secretion protein V
MRPASPAGLLSRASRASRVARGSRADLAFAAFVVAIVGLLIVPIPTPLLDVLLATSLAFAVVVLLVVLYVGDALAIATFPTLLLLTTLYRLALNVSTSRLILLRGDAGEVIRAFGNFVVRGNYLVGAIVFGILTIIQYLVIAKGSERVAEVAARFALDAMPGKQMAIDAELRSGAIDTAEARRRRRVLSRESQFYGAMDGAMKFVKGDVVAGLVITAINLLGGLAVGVLQRDMSAGDALRRFGLLTIGDGLVTQIPALVTSTAAGLLVTRVASEDPGAALGSELGAQLFGNAKALLASAAFVGLLAIVPGLPGPPFLVIGAVLAFLGQRRRTEDRRARREEGSTTRPSHQASQGSTAGPSFVPVVAPWSVEIPSALAPHLDGEDDDPLCLRRRLARLRQEVFDATGLPLAAPRITVVDELPAQVAVVSLREIPVEGVPLPELARGAGGALAVDDAIEAIARAARGVIERRGHELLGIGETQLLLDALEQANPALVRQVIPKPITVPMLADVLRRLLEERVSIRDLPTILEGIAPIAVTDKDPLTLAEHARRALRHAITHRLASEKGDVRGYLLDPAFEELVASHVTRTTAGVYLGVPVRAAQELVAAVRGCLEASPPEPGAPAILIVNNPDVRRFVRRVIEHALPELVVTTAAELRPEVNVTIRGRARPQ